MDFYEVHHPTSLGRFIRGKMGVPPTALLDALTLRVCDCDLRPPPRAPTSHPSSRSVGRANCNFLGHALARRDEKKRQTRMHASFEPASKWARNFPYSGEMDNLPSPLAFSPAIVVGDRSPTATAGDGAGGFIFITKRVRGPFLASAALTPRRSVRPILIEFKATSLLFI